MAELAKDDFRYEMKCWVARRPCGCIVAISSDEPEYQDKAAHHVAEWMRDGLDVDKIYFRDFYSAGLGCKCPKTAGEQMALEVPDV